MIEPAHFAGIPHNPIVVPYKDLVQDCYKFFAKKAEFYIPEDSRNEMELSYLLRFIIIFVNKKSPLYKEKDFLYREEVCLEWAGIDRRNSVYKDITEKSEWFLVVLLAYFKTVNDVEYETWFSLKMALNNFNDLIRRGGTKGADINAIKNLTMELPALVQTVLEAQQKLFPDDETMDLINATAISDSVGNWAEKHAIRRNFEQ